MISLLCAVLAAAPLPAGAPALLEQLSGGLARARVGEWTTYQLDGGSTGTAFWRLAVVGEQTDRLGRPALWLEIDVGDHPSLNAPLQQLRLLVAKGEGLRRSGITRLFVGMGVERPAEVEQDALARVLSGPSAATPSAPAEPAPGAGTRTGRVTALQTYAGTVQATPVEVMHRGTVVKRIWLSPQVPILHLARLEIPGIDYRLEVRDYGLDARPRMIAPAPSSPKISLEPRGEQP